MERSELLRLLLGREFVSGEEIGQALGVTRAAVSKAVAGLKKEGYLIASVPNRGYRLDALPDALTQEQVLLHLHEHPWATTTTVYPVIDSTNDHLKRLAAQGAPHGTVAVADCQTGGRGRTGRSFDSKGGSGIYLSVLLRPHCRPDRLMTLTAQTAVAVRRAILAVTGAETQIKWVNDLVLGGRKLCGILTELSIEAESGLVSYAVVGVGVNCNRPAQDFPPELQAVAGSILSQTGTWVDRSRLAAQMIRELSSLPELDWREEYRAACVNLGREVQILGAETCCGTAVDVGAQAELIVRLEGGELVSVNAGEVSVRGLYGYV